MTRAHYLDTSALVKLVVEEPESGALIEWLNGIDGHLVSSDLARTELMRAVRRCDPALASRAREVLESVALFRISTEIAEAAGRLDPTQLRSLDAIHLASALQLGDDLASFLTYDSRLAQAAAHQGIVVSAPSPPESH